MNAPQARFESPAACHAWMRAHGINISAWAREHGFDRLIVVDLLRGRAKGHRGEAHRAAVALGLKVDPEALDNAAAPIERRHESPRKRTGAAERRAA